MRIFNCVRCLERGFDFQELINAGYEREEVLEAICIKKYLIKCLEVVSN